MRPEWVGAFRLICDNLRRTRAPQCLRSFHLGAQMPITMTAEVLPFEEKQVSHLYTQMHLESGFRRLCELPLAHGGERGVMMSERNTPSVDTKVLSVRVPASEVSRIDADARDAGMNRNDFMRMRIRGESTFVEADKIIQLIDVLRQLERMMDAYLSILERLVENHEGTNGKETTELILDEMKRAHELMELLFKAQRQAVWTLRHIRREGRR